MNGTNGLKYETIHFNANPKERSRVAERFYNELKPNEIRGYTDFYKNDRGECSYLTWMQMYNVFTNKSKNPFGFTQRQLLQYDRKSGLYM